MAKKNEHSMSNGSDRFLEMLRSKKVLVADGAMATALYEKGFYINRSFEELSLTESSSVKKVHRGFKNAGAQILHTNTFSCSKPKLLKYGLQDQQKQIVEQSVALAKEVAGETGVFVFGLLGPLGVILEPLGPTSFKEAEKLFQDMVTVMEKSGVDGFSICGLHDLSEIKCAVNAIKNISAKPVCVNVGLQENLRTSFGHTLSDFVDLCESLKVDVLGVCGEIGPSPMLTALESLKKLTRKPLMALPNAGLPQYVNDQYIYLCNPDYMGKFAKRFVDAGAQIVGGNSGVGDLHIQAVANSIKRSQHQSIEVKDHHLPEKIDPIKEAPMTESVLKTRSKLGLALATGKKVFSIELMPPALHEMHKFEDGCKLLKKAKIDFVNIPDGARAMSRVSSLHLATVVRDRYGIEPIPHFTCRDRNLIGLQSDLLGAHVSGTRNVLLVTGDPPKLGNNPGATAVFDVDAIGLTHIVARMNKGLDIGGARTNAKTDFVVGVALNPTATNQDLELSRYRYKLEAGCDFAMTQPIYSFESFERFMDKLGKQKSTIPVVMGVWPLVSLRNAEFLKFEVPGVFVPDDVLKQMAKAGDNKEDAAKRGIEIAVKIMERAKKHVAGFQVSAPFQRAAVAIETIQAIR
jgi:methionine synthase I (cobalamin-dependent)/5,10-methylenetetrahydrofolate reductase